MCVLEGRVDEDTRAKLTEAFSEKNANSLNSEPPNSDHASEFRRILTNSEKLVLNSEKSQVVGTKIHLIPILRKALIKLAKTEYHNTVLDLDEFTRDFNSKTPEFKGTLGSFVVENEARKLKITGWRV